jgi:hypothetical protein
VGNLHTRLYSRTLSHPSGNMAPHLADFQYNNIMESGNYKKLFALLSKNLDVFIGEVKKKKSTLMATDEWTVKDELCHIVFWHENYAANYQALAERRDPPLPEGMSTINIAGVLSLRKNSMKMLFERLQKAHKSLYTSIVIKKVPQMTYSRGGRVYSTPEFLDVIARHLLTHAKQVKRAKQG